MIRNLLIQHAKTTLTQYLFIGLGIRIWTRLRTNKGFKQAEACSPEIHCILQSLKAKMQIFLSSYGTTLISGSTSPAVSLYHLIIKGHMHNLWARNQTPVPPQWDQLPRYWDVCIHRCRNNLWAVSSKEPIQTLLLLFLAFVWLHFIRQLSVVHLVLLIISKSWPCVTRKRVCWPDQLIRYAELQLHRCRIANARGRA